MESPPIENFLATVLTGCLRSTPANNLPILEGIEPVEFRLKGATLSLARRAIEPAHLLHLALTRSPDGDARHLKSRHPFVPAAQKLISSSDNNNRSARSGRITNGTWSGWTASRDSVFSSLTPAPTLLEWPCQEQRGFDSIASALVSDVSATA